MDNLKNHWEDEKDFPEDVRRKYHYTNAVP